MNARTETHRINSSCYITTDLHALNAQEDLGIYETEGPHVDDADLRTHFRVQRVSRWEDQVQFDDHRDKRRDQDAEHERHVRGLGHPEQAVFREVQGEVRALFIPSAALTVPFHAVDGGADENTHPEKVEACDERISVVHVVFEEQRKEAATDEDGDNESCGYSDRAKDPDARDECENAVPEVRRYIRNVIVVPDVSLRPCGFYVLLHHQVGFLGIDWDALFGDLDGRRLVFQQRDVVAVRNSSKGPAWRTLVDERPGPCTLLFRIGIAEHVRR